MADSVDVIAGATGIPRRDLLSMWEEVKANHARLDVCARHDFGELQPGKLGAKYTCASCGGWVDGSAASWYRQGLAHGAGNV